MWAVHRLIIVVSCLLIQVRIQACIDASKVVSAHILFWSAWRPSMAPLGACLSPPDVHPPMHICTCVDGDSASIGTHLYSSLVYMALYLTTHKNWAVQYFLFKSRHTPQVALRRWGKESITLSQCMWKPRVCQLLASTLCPEVVG